MNGNIKIPYAKLSSFSVEDVEQLIHASNASNGTNYYCPDCNGVLRKRTSQRGTPHFYHLDSDYGCSSGGLETTLHLLAKKVLEREQKVWIPDANVYFQYLNPFKNKEGVYQEIDSQDHPYAQEINSILNDMRLGPLYVPTLQPFGDTPIQLKRVMSENGLSFGCLKIPIKHGVCAISNVRVEKGLKTIKPDIIATVGGRDYLIEVANTHFVDDEKKRKIQQLNMPCVEIDLSGIHDVSYKTVMNVLTLKNHVTRWVHFVIDKDFSTQFKAQKKNADEVYIVMQIAHDSREKVRRRQLQKQFELEQEEERLKAQLRAQKEKEQELVNAEIARLNQVVSGENDKWVSNGFPPMKSKYPLKDIKNIHQILQALQNREARVLALGEADLISRNISFSEEWNELEAKGELYEPVPQSLKSYHYALVEAEKMEKIKHSFAEAMELESAKGSGGCILCPKCRRPGFQFLVDRRGESYRRKCVVKSCGYQVFFELDEFIVR